MRNKELEIKIVNKVKKEGHFKMRDKKDYLTGVESVTYLYDKNSKKEEHIQIMIDYGYSLKSDGQKLIYRDYSKPMDMFSKIKGYGVNLMYVEFEKELANNNI